MAGGQAVKIRTGWVAEWGAKLAVPTTAAARGAVDIESSSTQSQVREILHASPAHIRFKVWCRDVKAWKFCPTKISGALAGAELGVGVMQLLEYCRSTVVIHRTHFRVQRAHVGRCIRERITSISVTNNEFHVGYCVRLQAEIRAFQKRIRKRRWALSIAFYTILAPRSHLQQDPDGYNIEA